MKSTSVKAAKNALARTAAYLSVRVPKKTNPFTKNQRLQNVSDSQEENESSNETEKDNLSKENCTTFTRKHETSSSYISSETSHSLNTSTDPHSFIFESTQTAKLTLHSSPIEKMNNNSAPTREMNNNSTDCRTSNFDTFQNSNQSLWTSYANSQPATNTSPSWTSSQPSTNWSYSTKDTHNTQNGGNKNALCTIGSFPTPAPRNANVKVLPPYQNLPTSNDKKSVSHSECAISHPHKMHVLPVIEVCFILCRYQYLHEYILFACPCSSIY